MTINAENLSALAVAIIENSKSEEVSQNVYAQFEQLNISQIVALIDLIIEDADNVKSINALIRVRETAKVVLDHKLIFNTIKNALNAVSN